MVGCFISREGKIGIGRDRFTLAKYPTKLCSHIIFDAAVNENFEAVIIEFYSSPCDSHDVQPYILEPSWYEVLRDMKRNDSNLKVILSFGRYDKFADSTKDSPDNIIVPSFSEFFKQMLADIRRRITFIHSAISLIAQNDFDGIHIDYEIMPQEKQLILQYTQLLQELRMALDKRTVFERKQLLLTKVLYGSQQQIDVYDQSDLNTFLDYIFLSPVYLKNGSIEHSIDREVNEEAETGDLSKRNIIISAYYLHRKGIPKSKIVLGIPSYAVYGSLRNNQQSSAVTSQLQQPHIAASGIMAYDEVCKLLGKTDNTDLLDNDSIPFIVFGDKWLSFENRRSIAAKTLWLKQHQFAGAFSWTMDLDDHQGSCPKNIPFRVITTIRHFLSEPATRNRQ
uniref:Glyco_18 domain-containing protein n=1 Tax=Syphacia muris TaxID=451379 RepID=A0A0N5AZ22_9BILA